MGYRKRKVDLNQSPLTKALRDIGGISVQPVHTVGKGVPDLLVGVARVNILLELKTTGKSTHTEDEIEWASNWLGQVDDGVTLIDCLTAIINCIKYVQTPFAIKETLRLSVKLNDLKE